MKAAARMATRVGTVGIVGPPTTHGMIALFNLQAQIDSLQQDTRGGHRPVESGAALAELLTLRGVILGRVEEYEKAEMIVEALVRDAPADPTARLAQARIRAVFHRFSDALDDLERAERLSLDADTANGERAAIFQAQGQFDDALLLWEEAAKHRPSFTTIGALAGFWAERGDSEAAQHFYEESLGLYRGVSPFPLALLDFQIGLMWMNDNRLEDARTSFDTALRRVPAYAPAQGHLAEVEAELGQADTAIARLYSLAITSDDADYAGQLARILRNVGRNDESRRWRELAAARFDELTAIHPEAFADHAAEFWLAAGADPLKALSLARTNYAVRQTPRARELLAQAMAATERPVRSLRKH